MIQTEGISIQFVRITRIPPAIRKGLEVIFVLNGSLSVHRGGTTFQLGADQMLAFNGAQPCSYFSSTANSAVLFHASDDFLHRHCDALLYGDLLFDSAETAASDSGFLLKRLFSQMIFQYIRGTQIEFEALLYQFLCQVYRSYNTAAPVSGAVPQSPSDDFSRLLDYLNSNYQERISLNDAAAHIYMSPQSFSRYFKQKAGINFSEYLAHLRAEQAANELLSTSRTLSQIASDTGFANEKAFTTAFRRFYHTTPGHYRKQASHSVPDTSASAKASDSADSGSSSFSCDDLQDFIGLMQHDSSAAPLTSGRENRHFTVSVTQSQHRRAFSFHRLIAVDKGLASVLYLDTRKQLETAQKHLSFDYVCISSFDLKILEGNASVIEEGDFAYGDSSLLEILELYRSLGLTPYLQLSLSWLLQSYSENIELFYGQFAHFLNLLSRLKPDFFAQPLCLELGCPQEEQAGRFPDFCRRIFHIVNGSPLSQSGHLCIRTGLDLSSWMLDTNGDSVFSDLQGLPFTFCGAEWFPFQNKPLYIQDLSRNLANTQSLLFEKQWKTIERRLALISPVELPLYVTCWNVLAGAESAEIGTFYRAAIILDALIWFDSRIQGIAFPCRTLQTVSSHVNALALFYVKSVKRPVFFVLDVMNKLKADILFQNNQSLVVRHADGSYAAALFSPTYVNPALSLDRFFVEHETTSLQLCLRDLKRGRYRIKRLIYDKDSAGIYKRSLEIGLQDYTDPDFMARLETIIQPQLYLYREQVTDGSLLLHAELSFNSIVLFLVTPETTAG